MSPFENLITPSTGFARDVATLTSGSGIGAGSNSEGRTRQSTKTRIVHATEGLFLQRGFEGTSLRAITTEANVNLAAVNYHFGSKEELFAVLLTERLDPLYEDRARRLEALKAQGVDHDQHVEQIIATLFMPALTLARDPARGGLDFLRFIGRAYADPSDFVRNLLAERYAATNLKFKLAFAEALPELNEHDLAMRLSFILDAVSSTLASEDVRKFIGGLPSNNEDDVKLLSYLAPFLGAALRANVRTQQQVAALQKL
ncbi:MAG: TetR/AcrR family transcriptional regulator [Casimicrobium sp.]